MTTNADRAERAMSCLDHYAKLTNDPHADATTATCDLLADLLHLHGEQGFDDCLRMARQHHEEECDA